MFFCMATTLLSLLSFTNLLSACSSFAPLQIIHTRQHHVWQLKAVTEEEVLTAVEKTEGLWAQALAARKSADEAG